MDETKGKKKFSKKRIIVIAIAVVFLILLFPVPFTIKDGGSKGFEAILYNVTHWNSMSITKAEDGREYDSLIKGTTVEILGFTVYDSRWVDVGDVLGPTSTPSPTDAPATLTETVTPTGAATPTVAPGPTVSWDECMKKYAIPKIDAAIDGTSYAYSEVFSSAAEGDRLSYSVYDSDSEFYHAPNNLPVNENYLCDNCISEIRRYDRNMNVRKITYYADNTDNAVKTVYRTPYGICTETAEGKTYYAHCEVIPPGGDLPTMYLDGSRVLFYDYDDAGRLTRECVYHFDELEKRTDFAYDADGNLISQKISDPASYCFPDPITEYTLSYQKDAEGRLSSCTVIYREDDEAQLYTYNLHYYKDGTVALYEKNADFTGMHNSFVFFPGKGLSDKLLTASNLGTSFRLEDAPENTVENYFISCVMEYFPKAALYSFWSDDTDLMKLKNSTETIPALTPGRDTQVFFEGGLAPDLLSADTIDVSKLDSGLLVAQYDGASLTQYGTLGDVFNFGYDKAGRLVSVRAYSLESSNEIRLEYDGEGRLISRKQVVTEGDVPADRQPAVIKSSFEYHCNTDGQPLRITGTIERIGYEQFSDNNAAKLIHIFFSPCSE